MAHYGYGHDDELGRRNLASRPLIDRITNDWRRHPSEYDVSDTESDYGNIYASDKFAWYSPAVYHLFATQRSIPRRIQRAALVVVAFVATIVLSWRWLLGPYWQEQSALSDAFSGEHKYGEYGLNARPAFSDMIQVKELDSALLPTTQSDKQRLVFVGDVHGCKAELVELLHQIEFLASTDHLILTGDMIAKGPDSPGVVDLARDLRASCVRGNHEDRVLLARRALVAAERDLHDNRVSMSQDEGEHAGGAADKDAARAFNDKQVAWLEQCPVMLRVGRLAGMGEVVVAHAGIVPGVSLSRQDPYLVMNMRSIDLETKVPSEGRDGTPWEKYWNFYQKRQPASARSTIVYGHDSKRGLNLREWSKGLDSGCVRGGALSALVVEADPNGGPVRQKVVSVPCRGGAGGGVAGKVGEVVDKIKMTGVGGAEKKDGEKR